MSFRNIIVLLSKHNLYE